MDFVNQGFLDSFRFLLSRLNLPKDANLILGIIDIFTVIFYEDNKTKFKDSTSLYLLSSSILALNVTLHRNLPSMALMKKDEFIRMNKDVNPEILESIYEEIKNNKLEITYECKIIFLKKK